MRVIVMGQPGSGVALAGASVAAGVRAEFVDGDDLALRLPKSLGAAERDDAWLTLVAAAFQRPATVVASPLLPREHRDRLREVVPDVRFVELVPGAGRERRTRVPRRDRAARAARAAQAERADQAFTPLGADEPGVRVADDADLTSVVTRIVTLLTGR